MAISPRVFGSDLHFQNFTNLPKFIAVTTFIAVKENFLQLLWLLPLFTDHYCLLPIFITF